MGSNVNFNHPNSDDDVDGGILRPLAVIGMSYRLPGGSTSDESFWEMLVSKRCASSDVPPDRFNIDAHYNPDSKRLDTLSCRGGHYIEGRADVFDAGFFGIGATEASSMDPLHRISLEESFRAFENAGLSLQDVSGTKTCVFSGCLSPDYVTICHKDTYAPNQYHASGSAINMLANRVSWWFDLRGPSVTVDTACSSSLVALDLACQSIWAGDASMGLVCGANMMLTPESQLYLNNLGMLSKDSRSYSFDHRANGYGRGEGVGVVIVQPLEDAIRDGRTIRAVIRSTCSNQDGKTPGITQPSKEAQYRLILDTYAKAGLKMDFTRYFEAHGTGTPLGDPIEAAAIGKAFRRFRSSQEPLYLGSVKSNIGHLEGGSGVAGVIKTILALENGVIAPNAGFQQLNPKIDAEFLNIKVAAEALSWPCTGLRRASVQSFGFGGSNSHVVLDDAFSFMRLHGYQGKHRTKALPGLHADRSNGMLNDDAEPTEMTAAPRLLVWSTTDEAGITRTRDAWRKYTDTHVKLRRDSLGNLAHTLARRNHFSWRSMAVVTSADQLDSVADLMSAPIKAAASPQLGLVFTGQGSQWYAMGRELVDIYAVFKESLLDAHDYLASLGCAWNPITELKRPEKKTNVNLPLYSSLCTILQVALVELLQSFNLQVSAVVGHSSGEIAAAFCAGDISREAAWKIAYYRGVVSSQLAKTSKTKGSMIAVGLAADKIQPYIDLVSAELGECLLTVACVNSPSSVTVSGEEAQVDRLKCMLDADKVFCRKLRVGVAYHSFQMEEVANNYLDRITSFAPVWNTVDWQANGSAKPASRTRPSQKRPAMVSSVTGTWISSEELARPEYWVRNLVSPVLFADALEAMTREPSQPQTKERNGFKKLDGSHRHKNASVNTLLEVGPHSALQAPIRDILRGIDKESSIPYVSLLSRSGGVSATDTLLAAMGRLHCLGHSLDLGRVNSEDQTEALTNLPPYPFNHSKSYWFESRASRGYRLRQHPEYPLLGAPEADFNPLEAKWRKIIRTSDMPWVEDHRINGTILYPAAGMLAMAIEAARQLADPAKTIEAFVIKNVTLHSALNIPANASPSAGVEVNMFLRPRRDQDGKNAGWFDFRLCTYDEAGRTWFENCHGSVQLVYQVDHSNTTGGGIDKGVEERLWRAKLCHEYHSMMAACSTTLPIDEFYNRLARWGFDYGPAFRDMTSVASDGEGGAAIEVKTFQDTLQTVNGTGATQHGTDEKSQQERQEYIVHPATLDCIFQAIIVSMTNAGTNTLVTGIPTHFDKIWLSARGGLRYPQAQYVKAYGRAKRLGLRQTETTIGVVDSTGTHALAKIEGFVATDISGSSSDNDPQTDLGASGATSNDCHNANPLCHTIEWKPDLDLVTDDHWRSLAVNGGVLADFGQILDSIVHKSPESRIMVENATGSGDGVAASVTDRLMSLLVPQGSTPRFGLFHYADPATVSRDAVKELYQHLGARMRFSQPAVEEALPDNEEFEAASYDLVIAIKDPCIKQESVEKLKRYRSLLKDKGHLVFWNPIEMSLPQVPGDLANGALSNGFQDGKPVSSMVQVDDGTCKHLTTAGFSEAHELTFQNPADAVELGNDGVKIVMARAVKLSTPPIGVGLPPLSPPAEVNISIIHGQAQQGAAAKLQQYLLGAQQFTAVVQVQSLDEAVVNEEARRWMVSNQGIRILLLELDQPIWYDINCETFARLQRLLSVPGSKALWVQKGAGSSPNLRLVDGVSRVLNSEVDTAALSVLRLEGNTDNNGSPSTLSLEQLGHILQLCRRLSVSSDAVDTEYMEQNGILHIPRLISRPILNKEITTRLSPRQNVARPWHTTSTTQVKKEHQVPLRLGVGSPGLLNTLHWAEDTENTPVTPLGDDEVEIRVHSVGLNFRDLLMVLGRVNHSGIGSDISGIVTRLGQKAAARGGVAVGDKVAACRMNSFRSLVRCPRSHVVKIPEDSLISLSDAASLPTNFVTAWQCLSDRAHLAAGETVLIHSAAGGTGQAAVQVAQYLGATIIATVGTEEKKQLLVDRYGIAPDHILSSRESASFARGVMRLTEDRGVDVVFNSLSGEGLVASWECIAPFGRFVEIGKKDIIANNSLPMTQFARNVSFSAYDLSEMLLDRAEQAGAALKQVVELIEQGKMTPVRPLHVFGAGEVEKAFRALQSGKTMGKVVVEFRPDEQVEALIETKPSFSLDPQAAYIVAGGLGGLGRSISRWLAGRGAKTLILLSRSGGSSSPEAEELVSELHSQGVKVIAPVCDISHKGALAAALSSLPPIKGCIQASMVLRDAPFEFMSFDSWQEALASKVAGTWNLHEALPSGIDFFIMLSSVASTCGTKGQSNYAAGNAFQNAVAHYRVKKAGQRGTALALGPFFDVGVMAHNDSLRSRFDGASSSGVTEVELLALLDYYCDPVRPLDAEDCNPTIMRFGHDIQASKLGYLMRKPMLGAIKAAMASAGADNNGSGAAGGGSYGGGRAVDFARFFSKDPKPTEDDASELVSKALAAKLAEALSISRDEIDVTGKPIHSFGVDSLVAVEIRNWLSKEVRADVAIFDILEASSVAALGALALGKSGCWNHGKNDM